MTAAETRRIETRNGNHWYKLDGKKVNGVTTVLNQAIPKQDALVPWASKGVAAFAYENPDLITALKQDEYIDLLKNAPYRERDRAARRGTEVHGLAVGLLHGEEVDVPDELAGHVDTYIRFLQDWDVQPVIVEAVVGNRTHQWMGTLDAVGDFNDGIRRLYDIKTTRSGIYPETTLQVAAYRNAEFYLDAYGQERPMIPVDACAAVWVRADGYDLIPLDAGAQAYKTFRHAIEISHWQTDIGKTTVGDSLIAQPRLEVVQ